MSLQWEYCCRVRIAEIALVCLSLRDVTPSLDVPRAVPFLAWPPQRYLFSARPKSFLWEHHFIPRALLTERRSVDRCPCLLLLTGTLRCYFAGRCRLLVFLRRYRDVMQVLAGRQAHSLRSAAFPFPQYSRPPCLRGEDQLFRVPLIGVSLRSAFFSVSLPVGVARLVPHL